jgi:hypothetical protein
MWLSVNALSHPLRRFYLTFTDGGLGGWYCELMKILLDTKGGDSVTLDSFLTVAVLSLTIGIEIGHWGTLGLFGIGPFGTPNKKRRR